MADNVSITAGSGTTIATDDVSGVQYQKVKLDLGGDGLSAPAIGNTTVPLSNAVGLSVREVGQDTWSDGFSGTIAAGINANWTELRNNGMTRSQASSNFAIVTGTTANSEYLARTNAYFDGAMAARLRHTLSQRIANNNFAFMLADRIGDTLAASWTTTALTITQTGHGFTSLNVGQSICIGGITNTSGTALPGRYAIASITDANTYVLTVAGFTAGSGTVCAFGRNYLRALFTGTTATNLSLDTAASGWADTAQTVSNNTTASPGHIMQISLQGRDCYVCDALVSTSSSPAFVTRGSRYEFLPDQTTLLYVYLWAYNGTSAPATTTTWTVGQVTIESFAPQPVMLSGTRQTGNAAPAPVTTVGTSTVSCAAGTNAIGDVGVAYRANATNASTIKHIVSLATANPTSVKASAGRLLGWSLANTTTTFKFVKLHNTAGTPTAGAAVVQTIAIPPNAVNNYNMEGGIAYATGIGYTITGASPDADTTVVAVGDVIGDLFYA